MRAPSPSFKSEITAYRRTVLDGAPPSKGRDLVSAVLDRWQEHPDTERIWNDINGGSVANKTAPVPALLFIAWLVRTRMEYERLANVIAKTSDVYLAVRQQAERDWKAGHVWDAAQKRTLVEKHAKDMDAALGRKKTGAPKQHFMRLLRDMFIENCGKPLNEAVAVLTEIAFDDPVTTDAARKARRKIRPPK
jgi:hypothetical protein